MTTSGTGCSPNGRPTRSHRPVRRRLPSRKKPHALSRPRIRIASTGRRLPLGPGWNAEPTNFAAQPFPGPATCSIPHPGAAGAGTTPVRTGRRSIRGAFPATSGRGRVGSVQCHRGPSDAVTAAVAADAWAADARTMTLDLEDCVLVGSAMTTAFLHKGLALAIDLPTDVETDLGLAAGVVTGRWGATGPSACDDSTGERLWVRSPAAPGNGDDAGRTGGRWLADAIVQRRLSARLVVRQRHRSGCG